MSGLSVDFGEAVFLRTMCARQDAFLRREAGMEPPWSDDPLIAGYTFTNVYRVLDRNSQYLITDVLAPGPHAFTEQLYRILLFRLFNRTTTWERMSAVWPTWETHDREYLWSVIRGMAAAKESLFTASYSSPQTGVLRQYAGENTAERMVTLAEAVMAPRTMDAIIAARDGGSFEALVNALKAHPGIGDFMANQLALDVTYTEWGRAFADDEWTVAGPGAKKGLRLIYSSRDGMNSLDSMRHLYHSLPVRLEEEGLTFRALPDWRLRVSDVEHWLCETYKYVRLAALWASSGGRPSGGRSTKRFVAVGPLEPHVVPWVDYDLRADPRFAL